MGKIKQAFDLTGILADAENEEDARKRLASAFGRLGGLRGGPARALSLSSQERSNIAKKAAETRWKDKK